MEEPNREDDELDELFEEDEVVEIKKTKRKSSKLTKEEEKAIRDLKITVPPKVKRLRTKAQLFEYWKAIFIAVLTIVVFFLYFQNSMINIWVLRVIEILLIGGVILLAEKLYHNFKKTEFLLLLEVLFYSFALLICSEMVEGHPLFNGNFLLIFSFCYIIYYIIKGMISSRIIYVEYMRSRSDIREILKDNRESYI